MTVAQKPTDMDFGRTFVVLDPDGHKSECTNSMRRSNGAILDRGCL